MSFEIGDRVISLTADFPGLFKGEYGVVVGYNSWGEPVVEWDDYNPNRHDADGAVPEGHGWFISSRHIEFAKVNDLGELPLADPNASSKFLFDM